MPLMTEFELWLTTDTGRRLALIDNVYSFTAGRTMNEIGYFNGSVPLSFDPTYIKLDNMIQVWFRGKLWRPYFLRKWRWERNADGVRTLSFKDCPDCNDLLRRRHVIGFTGSVQEEHIDVADDMMKQMVTDSQSDLTLPVPDAGTREWDNFSVAADLSFGPALQMSFKWGNLLTSLQDVNKASKEAGTEIWFDVMPVVSRNGISFEFRTYSDQPGNDRTDDFTFNEESGTLTQAYYEEDWTKEVNYLYAGGEGTGPARELVQVYNSSRYGMSSWNRREGFLDAPDAQLAVLTDMANMELERQGRIIRAGGVPVDTDKTRFWRDWGFGDKVRVNVRLADDFNRYKSFDCIVGTVVLGVSDAGDMVLETRFDYDGT